MAIAITVVVVLAVLVIGVLGLAAISPPTFRIERSTSIKAPPDKIFPLINDFHNWVSWSPWENLDPALKRTYSGAANGMGAVYEWEGNKNVGQGRMEITEASPPSEVVIKLDFLKPFPAHNVAEFTIEGAGGAANVMWAMHGPRPFMIKVMNLFISMDKMLGKQFETGLANMKSVAEH